jgi:glycosyltransferase involved in cell wall biosynthesis
MTQRLEAGQAVPRHSTILMLLTNAYDPDPRVRAEALALLGGGYRVRLLAWDRDIEARQSECVEGVDIRRVQVRSTHGRGSTQLFFYVRVYWKMLIAGYRTRFDAVHCHDLDTLPLGFILAAIRRKPLVYDAHESFTDMLAGSVHPWLRRALVRLEDLLIRRVDLLVTVGEKLRRHFEERGARHSVTVGNWKRPEDYGATRDENFAVRRRLGIPDDALVVVCITQLLKDRKIQELLDAVDSSAGVYAVIGGTGGMQSFVRERAAKNPRIVYLGFVNPHEIPAYTSAGDVVYYGFDPDNPNARFSAPNKLYEALAAGRPLITGDFGEIADVVREARCGIVLPHYSGESVRQALAQLRDPNLRETMADNAARHGRSAANWNRAQEILCREYSSLISARTRLALCLE